MQITRMWVTYVGHRYRYAEGELEHQWAKTELDVKQGQRKGLPKFERQDGGAGPDDDRDLQEAGRTRQTR